MTLEQPSDIDKRFTYHPPVGDQAERYDDLRGKFRELAHAIVDAVPMSREQSLALTKLEESCFWANAGIARNE